MRTSCQRQCAAICFEQLTRIMLTIFLAGMLFQEAKAQAPTTYTWSSTDAAAKVAKQLVDSIVGTNKSVDPCRLYLVDKEEAVGGLLARDFFNVFQEELTRSLGETLQSAACEVLVEDAASGADIEQLTTDLAARGQPGFVAAVTIFHQSGGPVMFVTTHQPDGRFLAFSGKIDLPVAELPPTLLAEEPLAIEETPVETTAVAPTPTRPTEGAAPRVASELRLDVGGALQSEVVRELARAFLQRQPGSDNNAEIDEGGLILRLVDQPDAALQTIEIRNSRSSAAFDDLLRQQVDLVMTSRSIPQAHYDQFNEIYGVDMRGAGAEAVFGVDAVDIVVHPSNRLKNLTKEKTAEIFAGDLQHWDQDGAPASGLSGLIRAVGQTHDTFVQVGRSMALNLAVDNGASVSYLVSAHPQSIGYASMTHRGTTRSVLIDECGITYPSDPFLVRTEDHPLSRRLLLYSNPADVASNRSRDAFVAFVLSEKRGEGQEILDQYLVDLSTKEGSDELAQWRRDTVASLASESQTTQRAFLAATANARRLSSTFRFRFDSDEPELDQRAERDLANLASLLSQRQFDAARLMLFGFADSAGPVDYNLKLAARRAETIANRLRSYGVKIPKENVLSFGEEARVACNFRPTGASDPDGKAKNRRVEVWLRN